MLREMFVLAPISAFNCSDSSPTTLMARDLILVVSSSWVTSLLCEEQWLSWNYNYSDKKTRSILPLRWWWYASNLSSRGVKAYLWLLLLGRQRTMMTQRITEKRRCQNACHLQNWFAQFCSWNYNSDKIFPLSPGGWWWWWYASNYRVFSD